jgi:RimJ/RimL family protein N-acetyltransferase
MRGCADGLVRVAPGVVLRHAELDDAEWLFAALANVEIARFVPPPPTSVEGFRRYLDWATREREAGRHLALAAAPSPGSAPVGLFQLRRSGPASDVAEWGFVLAPHYWGSGLFMAAAPLVVDFALGELGVRRLEARSAVYNGRANGALAKLGAVCEARLSQSCTRPEGRYDEHLWAISARDWRWSRPARPGPTH